MKLWPFLVLLACLAAGCAPKVSRHADAPPPGKTPSGSAPSTLEAGLYGRWVGKKPEDAPAGKPGDPKASDPKTAPKDDGRPDMSDSMASLMGGFTIDLKNDYSFRMDLAGTNLDGTWELHGDEIRLKVEHVMGKPKADYAGAESEIEKEFAKFFEKPPSPKVRDSGKRLAVPHESAKGLVFTKESGD